MSIGFNELYKGEGWGVSLGLQNNLCPRDSKGEQRNNILCKQYENAINGNKTKDFVQ